MIPTQGHSDDKFCLFFLFVFFSKTSLHCTLISLAIHRKNREEVIHAIESELVQHGNPLASTGWGPAEIRDFCKWQIAKEKAGLLEPEERGGFADQLPKRGRKKMADVPKEVLWFKEHKTLEHLSCINSWRSHPKSKERILSHPKTMVFRLFH